MPNNSYTVPLLAVVTGAHAMVPHGRTSVSPSLAPLGSCLSWFCFTTACALLEYMQRAHPASHVLKDLLLFCSHQDRPFLELTSLQYAPFRHEAPSSKKAHRLCGPQVLSSAAHARRGKRRRKREACPCHTRATQGSIEPRNGPRPLEPLSGHEAFLGPVGVGSFLF